MTSIFALLPHLGDQLISVRADGETAPPHRINKIAALPHPFRLLYMRIAIRLRWHLVMHSSTRKRSPLISILNIYPSVHVDLSIDPSDGTVRRPPIITMQPTLLNTAHTDSRHAHRLCTYLDTTCPTNQSPYVRDMHPRRQEIVPEIISTISKIPSTADHNPSGVQSWLLLCCFLDWHRYRCAVSASAPARGDKLGRSNN